MPGKLTRAALAAQPAWLAQVPERVGEARLPGSARVLFTGCGTSYHAALACGPAAQALELVLGKAPAADVLVAISHEGETKLTLEAVEAFAGHVLAEGIRPASIAGPQDAVLPLWDRLAPFLGPARSVRPVQPFLAIDADPLVAPDPRVRRVVMDELEVLYPACVAMFQEEVGIDPDG